MSSSNAFWNSITRWDAANVTWDGAMIGGSGTSGGASGMPDKVPVKGKGKEPPTRGSSQ